MDLKFSVNENLLVYSAILGPKSKNFKAKTVKDMLYERHPIPFKLLRADLRVLFAGENLESTFKELGEQFVRLSNDFKMTTEHKGLLERTINYKIELENKWIEKKEQAIKHLEDILKIKLPDKTATVFVVPPEIGGGMYLGDMKIFWGHSEDWENYSLVYLAHEYLHSFLHGGKHEHAIIELATDNELRIRLNNGGQYFTENGYPVGHERLRSLEEKLLPQWKNYLIDKNQTIYDFIKLAGNLSSRE